MTVYIRRGKIIRSLEKETFGLNSNHAWKGLFLKAFMEQNGKIPGSPNVIKLSLP